MKSSTFHDRKNRKHDPVMDWLRNNYDKAILASACLLLLVCSALIIVRVQSFPERFAGRDSSQPIAWDAHIGGFVFGFFLFDLFDKRPPEMPELPEESDMLQSG